MQEATFYIVSFCIGFILLGTFLLCMGVRLETKRRTEKRFTDLEIKTKALEKLVIDLYNKIELEDTNE